MLNGGLSILFYFTKIKVIHVKVVHVVEALAGG
jgi:hypothetical protein